MDVIPTPGHNATHISFYDRNTGLFFSGDFLMPGRLLIDDTAADLASANRVAAFVKDRPITYVLGGHIELNAAGETFPWESHYHPQEHVLQLSKDDLLALPEAVGRFNGFYTRSGNFILMNQIRVLIAVGAVAIMILIAIAIGLIRFVRGRRRARVGNVSACEEQPMPIRRMQATIYFVTDWDAAIAFYRDVLGLKEVVNFPNRWALFGVPGGGNIALQPAYAGRCESRLD